MTERYGAETMFMSNRYTIRTALIVALGGFLMGFDASVISGVVGFIEPQFGLTRIELGWSLMPEHGATSVPPRFPSPSAGLQRRRASLARRRRATRQPLHRATRQLLRRAPAQGCSRTTSRGALSPRTPIRRA